MDRSLCVFVLAACACDQRPGPQVDHTTPPHHDAVGPPRSGIDARSPDAALPDGMLFMGGPHWIASDGDDLYFTDTGADAQIRRVSRRGGTSSALGVDERIAWSSGIAVTGADVFWGSESGLEKVAKIGGSVVELDHVQVRGGPIADRTSVFWFSQDLMAMPIGGGKPRRVARGSAPSYGAVAMAVDDSQVYWVDDAQHVMAAPKHGGATRTLRALWNPGPDSGAGPFRSAIAVDRDSVYAGFPLVRIPTHGGEARVLDGQLGDCSSIVIGREVIYVVVNRSLVSYPKAGGAPTVITTTDIEDDSQLALDDTNLYWTTRDSIHYLPTPLGSRIQ